MKEPNPEKVLVIIEKRLESLAESLEGMVSSDPYVQGYVTGLNCAKKMLSDYM